MIQYFDKNFTVGPSKLFVGVADFLCEKLKDGSVEISHRSKEFSEISENTILWLRTFFNIPENYKIFYTASSTESWEIVARGCVEKYSTHITNGNFGESWKNMFEKAGKTTQEISHKDWKTRVEINEIQIDPKTEFLALTANETSTGIAYTSQEISEIRKKFPELLLGVDITSSMGAVAYDFKNADMWHFSVQKGMGLPAGLGILIIGPKAWEKYSERENSLADVGCHHSLGSLNKIMEKSFQTPSTPNLLNIFGLGFVCKKFSEEFGNIKNLHEKIKSRAERIYDFFEHHGKFKIVPTHGRSETILVLESSEENISQLHPFLEKHKIIVSTGYGKTQNTQIRMANFAAHSDVMMEDLMNVLRKF